MNISQSKHPHSWVKMDVTGSSNSRLNAAGLLQPRWWCRLCGAQVYSIEITGHAIPSDCPVQLALDSMQEVMES